MPRNEDLISLARLDATIEVTSDAVHTRHNDDGAVTVWKRSLWRIGEGGFGAVYREECVQGRDTGLLRAVKVIQKPTSRTSERIDYSTELEAIARFSQLQYRQYFVRSSGWYDDARNVFIAMEFVKHGDLQQYVGRPMPEAEMQLIVSQVLSGLSYMHNLNYAHRDLKPANLLVFNQGPRWLVKIADFGLSKRVAEDLSSLRTQAAGTPGYMAPEQCIYFDSDDGFDNAEGDDDSENGRKPSYTYAVDIWALGVIAFQLLTTQLPFAGDHPKYKALRKYVRGKSLFPRDILVAEKITSAGCAWIEGCMAGAPHQRPTAGFSLRNKWPMGAMSESEVQQVSKKPSVPASSASAHWIAQDSGHATASRHRSLKGPESSTPRVQTKSQAPRLVPTTKDLSVFGIDNTECSWVEGQEIPADRDLAAEFSPDSQQLAVLPGNRAIYIWSARNGLRGTQLPGLSKFPKSIAISPDGRQIASVSADGAAASIWDLETWKHSRQFKGHKVDVKCIAFSPDGRMLATAGTTRSRIDLNDLIPNWTKVKVSIWNVATGAQMKYLEPRGQYLQKMAFSPDGSKLAFIDGGSSPQLWDPASGTELAKLEGRPGRINHSVYCMAFSPDGRQLAGGCRWGALKIWDTATGVQIKLKEVESTAAFGISYSLVSYSPDGRKLAFASTEDHRSGTLRIWDTVTGEETEQVIFSQDEKTERFRLFISPDGRRVAVCGTEKVSIWSR